MVFPGKRSAGCLLCKKRKIKCDEGRPGCRRCYGYGVPCPGYFGNLVFRSENNRLEAQHSKTSHHGDHRSPVDHVSIIKPELTVRSNDKRIPVSLLPDPSWESESLGYFLRQYVLLETGDCPGHLVFLPELYLSSDDASHTRPALKAVAYLSLFKYARTTQLEIKARDWYRRALASVRCRIEANNCDTSDDLIAAVMLLGLYEDIDGSRYAVGNVHVHGVSHILQSGKDTKESSSLYDWVTTQLLVQSFANNRSAVDLRWLSTMPRPDDILCCSVDLALKINKFSTSAQRACEEIYQATTETLPTAAARLLRVMRSSTDIQQEIDRWIESIPGTWKHRTCAPFVTYSSRWLSCFWALINTVLLFFHCSVVMCIDGLLQCDSVSTVPRELLLLERQKSVRGAEGFIASICSSIAYSMGEIDVSGNPMEEPESLAVYGYLLIWPLTALGKCHLSTPSQVAQAEAALQRIASNMGLNLAQWALENLKAPFAHGLGGIVL
ncbi:hypothetical protein BX600DRAFT_467122 [Xylariales sp. PMI_506]|nr:hypothetical protein BX600DRAFT_467122 [Xylariales sp. PMI_506]